MSRIKSNPYKTILTISFGFIIVFFVLEQEWALYIASLFSFLGLLSSRASKLVEKVWFKIAELLGLIIPNIILAVIFYFLLFPTSMLSKLFKKPSNILIKNNLKTTYKKVSKEFTKKDLLNPF